MKGIQELSERARVQFKPFNFKFHSLSHVPQGCTFELKSFISFIPSWAFTVSQTVQQKLSHTLSCFIFFIATFTFRSNLINSIFKKSLFICMGVLSLSCSMWDLLSSLQPVGYLVEACGIQFPNQGLNLDRLHWESEVLDTLDHQGSPFIVLKSDYGLYVSLEYISLQWSEKFLTHIRCLINIC